MSEKDEGKVSWKVKYLTGNKEKGLPPAWILALDSHIAWGVAIPSFTGWVFHNFVFGAILILFIDLLKELFADPYFEGLPFWTNGLFDWLEYWAGIAGAAIVAFLFANYLHVRLSWLVLQVSQISPPAV